MINYLAFAIPLFLLLMGLEYLITRRQGKNYFRFSNSIANLNVGIAERLLDLFTVGIFYFVYDYLHRQYALLDIRPGVLSWLGLFIGTDFVWYWYHRLAHQVNLFWSVHVVHHQSEDFNYTVSARITVLQALVRTGFWSVLPVIGFPAEMISSMLLVHGAYPFFIHTRMVGKLGLLEYLFVTPSHHRVHHASNAHYLDKNYGDVLIIWDKLFGTFAEEKEEPVYGLTKPLTSYSFLWQHFHFMLELLATVSQTPGWRHKLTILLGKPDHVNPDARQALESKWLAPGRSAVAAGRFRSYVVWQTGSILMLLFLLLLFEKYLPVLLQSLVSGLILLTLINVGAILEQKTWVFYLEYLRFIVITVIGYACYPKPVVLAGLAGIAFFILLYLVPLKRYYLQLVYGREASG